MKNWYAVYTKPRCEKKVTALLTKKKIENYCPMNKVARAGQYDYRNGVFEPLFQNFVFVRVNEMEMNTVRNLNDVVNFVYWLGRPAMIKDVEIESIQQFMGEYVHAEVEKMPVNRNEMVRIISTPGFEMEGNLVTMKNNKVRVILPSLGFALISETEKVHVGMTEFNNYRLRDKVS
ncbi:MAG: UpxY family transcription antiterminator [Ferruginibacter sp.]